MICRGDLSAAGERSEGGHHEQPRLREEAAIGNAIAGRGTDANRGMNVAGDRKGVVAIRLGERRTRLVDKVKRGLVVCSENRVDAETGRQSSDGSIVVACDENDLSRREEGTRRGELCKDLSGASTARVKEVAEDKEPAGSRRLGEHNQPSKIFLRRALWNRNTVAAKRSCFAKMEIGHEQRRSRWQKRCSPGDEHDVGVGFRGVGWRRGSDESHGEEGQVWEHSWACCNAREEPRPRC